MTKTKSVRTEGSGQTVDYTEHVTLQHTGRQARHTLRIHIHADGYVQQSYGEIERWDGTKWHEVARIRGCALRVDLKIGYSRAGLADRQQAFQSDRNALVALAEEVL